MTRTFLNVFLLFSLNWKGFIFGYQVNPQEKYARYYLDYAVNLNRPVFVNCDPSQQIALGEEQPKNTYVTTVTARDPDEGLAGQITYSIAGNSANEFAVDPRNGTVYTLKVFDRDEPTATKCTWVTVVATGSGTPALQGFCTLRVDIVDINDNAPMFDKTVYETLVPVNANLGPVMTITTSDSDDLDNGRVSYSLETLNPLEEKSFDIESRTGVLNLVRSLSVNEVGYQFNLKVAATDSAELPLSSEVAVSITVAASKDARPAFTSVQPDTVTIPENYSLSSSPVATLQAKSGIEDPRVFFRLRRGRILYRNTAGTFRIHQEGSTAQVFLNKPLDFELISRFELTVEVRNSAGMEAETSFQVHVTDVNDNIPVFTHQHHGIVLENSPAGTFVTRVEAYDRDVTFPFNLVRYNLTNFNDCFAIDEDTGILVTVRELDREEQSFYPLTVVAYDGFESALTLDGNPNKVVQTVMVEVLDLNDNAPYFPKPETSLQVAEDTPVGTNIFQIAAMDNDSDSRSVYVIAEGNIRDAFHVHPRTGLLQIKSPLDYETRTFYVLVIQAFDGVYNATLILDIIVRNVNDSPPRFLNGLTSLIPPIKEETLYLEPIFQFIAEDPEYAHGTSTKKADISFSLRGPFKESFRINNLGELTVVKPLNRDAPSGVKNVSLVVVAHSLLEGLGTESSIEVHVTLEDINDNAPFINSPKQLVWNEHQVPDVISLLNISDFDEPQNGPPYSLSISEEAAIDTYDIFAVEQLPSGSWALRALKEFDREDRQFYQVPIVINDSGEPVKSGTSTVTVIIGDLNDQPMTNGSLIINVFTYWSQSTDIIIGKAYVEDLDDWDAGDKSYVALEIPSHFELNENDGSIVMKKDCATGSYEMTVEVQDRLRPEEVAYATISVVVTPISELALNNSGSMRIRNLSAKDFITPRQMKAYGTASKKDILRKMMSQYFELSETTVQIFSIAEREGYLDVRYSVESLTHYHSSRLDGVLASKQHDLSHVLGAEVTVFDTDQCRAKRKCNGTCRNELKVRDGPYAIYTNRSSFIGIDVQVNPVFYCENAKRRVSNLVNETCLNGGTSTGKASSPCDCKEGFIGTYCEATTLSLTGDGWGWYKPLPSYSYGHLTLTVLPLSPNGIILYAGSNTPWHEKSSKDFIALELVEGLPVAHVSFGGKLKRLELPSKKRPLLDDTSHDIELSWGPAQVQLKVDDCQGEPWCTAFAPIKELKGPQLSSFHGPLQVGGLHPGAAPFNFETRAGFHGCLGRLAFQGELYDLTRPELAENISYACRVPKKTSYFGFMVGVLSAVILLALIVTGLYACCKRNEKGRYDAVSSK